MSIALSLRNIAPLILSYLIITSRLSMRQSQFDLFELLNRKIGSRQNK